MGILERTRNVVRSDLNDLIRRAKNPEATLEAYLEDLKSVQTEARSLRAAESADANRVAARRRDLRAAQQTWRDKARTLLLRGDEELARSALDKQLDLQPDLEEQEDLFEQRQSSLDILEDSIEALRLRIAEVARKRRELRYRREVLQARSELHQAMGKLDPDQDGPILEAAEQGLHQAESRLEASETMEAERVENRFRRLEAAERRRERQRALDLALENLKQEIDRK